MKPLRCALLMLFLLACGCARPAVMAAPEPTSAPATPSPTPTASPTPSPTPNPLRGVWTTADGAFYLTLSPDGTFETGYGDRVSGGTFEEQEGRLLFLPADGKAYAVAFLLSGDGLTIRQREQADIVLGKGA